MKALDNFYLQQTEPIKSCFMALRDIILAQDKDITNEWKYGGSFFCYKGKMFCYLWYDKKTMQPYIGFVEGKYLPHPSLEWGNRTRIKVLMMDTGKDLPLRTIRIVVQEAIGLYKQGIISLPKPKRV